MDVGVYVTELLQKLDEVSLSGIGTFYKKRTSAYFDNKQGIFFPPSTEYAFDADRQNGSNELINYVCQVRNISEPSARYFIEKYVDSVKQSLQIKGYAAIDSIGRLRAANNSYVFEPAAIENSADSYGLVPVVDIERKAKKLNNSNEPDFSAIRIKTSPPVQEKPVVEKTTLKEEKSNKSAILIVITFLLLGGAIVAAYFFFPNLFKAKQKEGNTPVVTPAPVKPKTDSAVIKEKALKESEASADSMFEKSITQLGQEQGITVEKPRDTMVISTKTTPLKKSKDSIATSATSPSASAVPTIKFEIIVAAFNKKSEAETYISQLRKKGIDAQIVADNKKPKFKISMGSFTNEEAAQKEKRRIQGSNLAKDAWVLTIKNK